MNEKANPHCADSNLRLYKLMESCVPLCLSLTKNYIAFFNHGEPLSPYFRHTFGPKQGWENIPVLSLKEDGGTFTMKWKTTSLEKKWIFYDVGNSAFTLLVSTIMPIYFNYLASSANVSEVDYLAFWGYATSAATIITAISEDGKSGFFSSLFW